MGEEAFLPARGAGVVGGCIAEGARGSSGGASPGDFAFWADRGYLVKALGGLPLSFFVPGQHGDVRDEELARRLMKTDEGELVLGVTRQAATTLYQVVGLVARSSRGRLGRVSAMYFHEIWREVGGGIALSREVLDVFFPGPAEAASRLFEDDWEEWGEWEPVG